MSEFDWGKYETVDVAAPAQASNFDWDKYETDSTKKKSSITQDVLNSIGNVPGKVWDMATSFPGEALGLSGQLLSQNPRVGANIISGLASGGAGLLNTPANIRDYLVAKNVAPESTPSLRLPESILPRDYDYFSKVLGTAGLPQEKQAGDALVFGSAQLAPSSIAGSAPAALALNAVGQNESPVTAALLPAGFKAAGKGVVAAANKAAPIIDAAKNIDLSPSGLIAKYAGNKLSLTDLAKNFEATKGSETPIGDVIGSAGLKKLYENKVAPNPWSGAENVYGRIENQIKQKADDLVYNKLGNSFSGEDANPFVKSLLDTAYKSHNTVKNNLYNGVSDLAQHEGLNLELPSFQKLAKDNAEAINDSPLLKTSADFKNAYSKLTSLQKGASADGSAPSIRDAKLIANDLYDTGRQMTSSPNAIDRAQGGLYRSLGTALRTDVKNQINTKGSSTLKGEYNNAENYYKDEFVQFLDKDLYKMLDESKDPQTIVREIIKPGKALDKHSLIDKVQQILPPEQQNLLGYSYMRGAIDKEGVLSPQKLDQLVKNLGPRQFESLFPDKATRESILGFGRIKNLNNEAFNYMANPKTGARNLQFLDALHGSLIGGALGGAAAGVPGGLLGIAAGSAAKGVTASYMNKLLTSESFRKKVIDKKMANAAKGVNQ